MKDTTKGKNIAAVVLASILIIGTLTTVVLKTGGFTRTQASEGQSAVASGAKETSAKQTAEYDALFEKDRVIDIKIEVGEQDWKSMMDNPTAEEYKSANVTVDGVTVNNVGIRTKGNSSLRSVANSTSDRFSFRVKMNEYVKGQKVLGLDEFVLNNMFSDPSYMREYLSYEALRETGAIVPEAVFANIYINGKLYGFYLCVEAIDDSFLNRNFGENEGSLYKQEQGSKLQYVEGSNYESSELKSGDDETKADLKNFIKVLNEMQAGQKGDIESVLDVDSALQYIAVNTVLGSYDSYNGNFSHNYYLYAQNGKFTVLPWDYNMSIAGMGGASTTTIPIDEPVSGVNIKNLPLINNLLAVEEYKAKYHEYIKDYLKYLESFEKRVAEVADIIRPYVKADPTKFFTIEQFEANIKYSETSTTTTANVPQNANGNAGNVEQGQIPQGMPPGDMANGNWQAPQPGDMPRDNAATRRQGQMPQGVPPGDMANGNRQMPQQGDMGGNMRGGPNGGGMMSGSSVSIINYIRDRVENVEKQLAGELPTTGNTTMNNDSRMGGGNGAMGGNRNNR